MGRTVEKIIEEDDKKPELVTEDDGTVIVDQKGSSAGTETPKGPTPEEVAVDLRKQLEAANARADQEAQARRTAEDRAAAASSSAGSALQSQIVAQKQTIEGKITTATTNLDSIKQQLKQAKAAGDGDAEVELSDALTNARYELNTAKWEKDNFEKWEKTQTEKPVTTTADPYSAKEKAWIATQPEFYKNEKFKRAAHSAAAEALTNGIKGDTQAYFDYIEDVLKERGLLKAPSAVKEVLTGEPLSEANTSVSVAAAPSNAPASASGPVGKNPKYPHIPNGFRIPAEWVQAATDQGFDDPREYANMRLEDEAKGGNTR